MPEEKAILLTTETESLTGCEEVQNSIDVAVILKLHEQGWGIKRISKDFGISRNTVRKYIRQGEWREFHTPLRSSTLDNLSDWLKNEFGQHNGNADVIRQDLQKEHGINVSLRTVERAVKPFRRDTWVEENVVVRFETPPGRQMQIDFGQKKVRIGGEWIKVHVFVAILGYSRRPFLRAFRRENQSAWFSGIEGAFRHFGGLPSDVLIDNATSLVTRHNRERGEFRLNNTFEEFAAYWGFRIKACAPARPQTKGKVEGGVKYAKNNALAGHSFETWEELEAHLEWWMREVGDTHIVSTTGEAPLTRFNRDEIGALRSLPGKPPFCQVRECVRKVARDGTVELDTNHYSVPWRHIGELVRVHAADGEVAIRSLKGGELLCRHAERQGQHQRIIQPQHLDGIIRSGEIAREDGASCIGCPPSSGFSRPLSEYEAVVSGI